MSYCRSLIIAIFVTAISCSGSFAGETGAPPAKEPPAKTKEPAKSDEEKEIVVTATRLNTPREETGVSISTITDRDLEINQDTHAAEALRMVPGVVINQTGRKGTFTEVRTRGGEIDHTMMLIDGWKVNRFGGAKLFNFESLDPIGAQRIEIARGPGSALYGSEAMTGTINVISKKGEGRPKLTASAAAGTYGIDRESLMVEGRHKKFSYMVAASRLHREEASIKNSELETYNWNTRLDYDINDDHSLMFVTRGSDLDRGWYESTYMGFGPAVEEADPNDRIRNCDRLIGFEYTGRPVPIWETTVRYGHYALDLENNSRNPNPEFAPFSWPPFFIAAKAETHQVIHERRNMLEWRNTVDVYKDDDIRAAVTLGAYGEHEQFKERDDSVFFASNFHEHHINYAGYAQIRLELFDRAFITLDGRHEETEEYGDHDTGRADVSIIIPESDTRVFGSVGTAFRAPTFFELYANLFGNPDLKPEKSFAYDVGIEQHFWDRRIKLSATWFENEFRDLISFDPLTWVNINLGQAETRGFELQGSVRPIKHLELQVAGTLMKTKDDDDEELLRRPARVYTGRLIVHPLLDLVPEKWNGLDLSFEVLSVSSRIDVSMDPTTGTILPRVKNAGYCRGDIAVSYRFLEHFRAFARFENITDVKYEDVLTFPADGANALGGLEFNWRF
jgi:vitamin B12 transporter